MPEHDAEFARFVADRSAALLRLAYLLSADRAAAEDLVQTALIRAYLRWHRIATNPEAYVRRVLVTVAIDERRRPYRRREVSTAAVPDVAQPCEEPDAAVRLRVALRELPPRQRAAVVLRHWVDLDVAQVADVLGCSPGTVRSQTARGLDKLRSSYADATTPEEGAIP